jgi:hypothetical protein
VALVTPPPMLVPLGSRRTCWALAAFDAALATWMATTGTWFDRTSPLTAVVTLGGRHQLVLWLAVSGLVILLVTAVVTGGFVSVDRRVRSAVAAAAVLTVVAGAGLLSFALFAAALVAVLAVLGRALLR